MIERAPLDTTWPCGDTMSIEYYEALANRQDRQAMIADRQIAELEHRATHDELTGLPNRAWLNERLRYETTHHAGKVALLYIDLDGLKEINDTLGHEAGDDLIIRAARALTDNVRDPADGRMGDQVARLGGDEFAIVLTGVDNDEKLEVVKERLHTGLSARNIRASMGGRVHNASETDREFLAAADSLMYQHKQSRR